MPRPTNWSLETAKFTEEIREQILTYTDDKESKAMVNCLDAPVLVHILAGAKGCGKSFAFPCEAVYNIIKDKDYNAVMCRNLTMDIPTTIGRTFTRFLVYLRDTYKIDLIDFFTVTNTGVICNPTNQEVKFMNFQQSGHFAGLAVHHGYIGDLFIDEVMEKAENFQRSATTKINVEEFYKKQREDYEVIKESTILRSPSDNPRIIFSMNLWEPKHWIVEEFFNKVSPLNSENRELLERDNFLLKTKLNCDEVPLGCSILRLSRWYIPASQITNIQRVEWQKRKERDLNLYNATILGEAYKSSEINLNPFSEYILNEDGSIKTDVIISEKQLNNFNDFVNFETRDSVIGFDYGIRDNNALTLLVMNQYGEIFVLDCVEFNTRNSVNPTETTLIKTFNHSLYWIEKYKLQRFDFIVISIDSKDSAIFDALVSEIVSNPQLEQLVPRKAIKNHNAVFKMDFDIKNRHKFLKLAFESGKIKFNNNLNCLKLLKYLSEITTDYLNEDKRNEKINPKIYDLINSFEYALSQIYAVAIQLWEFTKRKLEPKEETN